MTTCAVRKMKNWNNTSSRRKEQRDLNQKPLKYWVPEVLSLRSSKCRLQSMDRDRGIRESKLCPSRWDFPDSNEVVCLCKLEILLDKDLSKEFVLTDSSSDLEKK